MQAHAHRTSFFLGIFKSEVKSNKKSVFRNGEPDSLNYHISSAFENVYSFWQAFTCNIHA